MSNLAKTYDPKQIESKWYAFWEKGGFFTADATSQKPSYCIVIPPPNVTGVLHMGHALVDTIQDALIRRKRMQKFEALWIPGTDHAGIATQGVVEKMLFAKTGKRRKDFQREEFLKHAWSWKEESEEKILGQIRRLGCSCDWSRLQFTMNEQCNLAVRTCFKKMFDEKLIYRGDYLVNWDPATQTALSDDEVEHEDIQSSLWHIRYPLENGQGSVIVATTRPETMLGDTAVAVHPEDERYKSLIGQKIRLPLTDRLIPIIADPFVDPSFGSGAVKITPAHDFNDFEVGHRHELPFINIMTPDGRMNENGGKFANLSMEKAREKVVEELQKHAFLEKIEPHSLRIGRSYRSKAIVQPYLSKQWFVKMSLFKKTLLEAIQTQDVLLTPPHWEATYTHWIENLRDWCISRQLWWGHQIPIWYHVKDSNRLICYDGKGLPPEVEKEPTSWIQDPDVLDTWFSSALWPLSTLGWPNKTEDFQKFYPTSTLVTAHDILFFWVARMIMMGEYITGKPPFNEVFLHGLIYGKSYWKTAPDGSAIYIQEEEKKEYDLGKPIPSNIESKWEKMSKTKGNVIDPLSMIDSYGTDALRFTLCFSTTHARQIDLDLRRFEEFKNFANKIWNGFRFVMMNVEDLSESDLMKPLAFETLQLEDKWILSILNKTIEEINDAFDHYAFDKLSSRAYEFFWNDFCSIFVELSKPVLFGKVGTIEDKIQKQKLLLIVLVNAIRLLHPIAPFITEEIFQTIKAQFPLIFQKISDPYTEELLTALLSSACIVAPFPKVIRSSDMSHLIEEDFAFMNELVRQVRNIRMQMQIPPSEKTPLHIIGNLNNPEFQKVQKYPHILLSLTPTIEIYWNEDKPNTFGSEAMVGSISLFIPIPESFKEKEKQRLFKEKEKLEKQIEQTQNKLKNPEFCAKAPKEIVQNLQNALTAAQTQIQEITLKLDDLCKR